MIKEELRAIKSSPRELKHFGLVIGLLIAAIGLIRYFVSHASGAETVILAGAILTLLGMFLPQALHIPYKLWMGFAVVMGWIMSRVILTVIFFAVVTPIGLVMRMLGKDLLELKRPIGAKTYWHHRSNKTFSKESYERQS